MSKLFLAIGTAVALGALAPIAQAKEFQLPEANPAVSVTLPDAWKPEAIDSGAQATSPDNGAYIALETSPAKTVSDLIDADIEFLKKTRSPLIPRHRSRRTPKSMACP